MLIGHDAAWADWRAALGSDRMHHAWILSGVRGLGKGQFARAAAAALVNEPGVHQPDAERHPDILVLDHLPANEAEEDKKADGKPYQRKRNITVDQIRRLQQRLTTRPTLGPRRAVIIDPADDMEKGAVNALLKSLEEPPQGTHFLLIAHRLGRLLPTIRSRCRILRFAPLGDVEVARIVAVAAPQADAATLAAAVAAGEGSPGSALEFVDQDLGAVHAIMQRLLREGDPRFDLRGHLAEAIGTRPDRDRLAATIDLARATLVADLRAAPPQRQVALVEAHAEMVRLAGQAPTYNFDPGLLAMEIGGLLASAAVPREDAA